MQYKYVDNFIKKLKDNDTKGRLSSMVPKTPRQESRHSSIGGPNARGASEDVYALFGRQHTGNHQHHHISTPFENNNNPLKNTQISDDLQKSLLDDVLKGDNRVQNYQHVSEKIVPRISKNLGSEFY